MTAAAGAYEGPGSDVPVLAGWIALPEAGRRLGISREGIHKMVRSGRLKTVHRLDGERAVYVVKVTEIDALLAVRQAAADAEADSERAAAAG
jgi:hypothetical protein